MTLAEFQADIKLGIPTAIPEMPAKEQGINNAPKRKEILSADEKKLAIRNALRYFPKEQHEFLAKEFAEELKEYGRIYMHRYRPTYKMYARPISEYPANCEQAASIMLNDPKQFGLCSGATPSRTDYLRWKWRCIFKLGSIPSMYEIPF